MQKLKYLIIDVYKKQEREGRRGIAHNHVHMLNVAEWTERYAQKRELDGKLAYFTGLLHDLVRVPREEKDESDRLTHEFLISVKNRKKLTHKLIEYESLVEPLRKNFKENELELMSELILYNGNSVKKILEIAKDWEFGDYLVALMYGDKYIEGMGFITMIRRFAFTMERIIRGDLADFLVNKDLQKRWEMALALESLIRIRWRKNVHDFPKEEEFKDIDERAKEEFEIYRALLEHVLVEWNFTSEWDLWQFGRAQGFPRFGKEEVRKRVESVLSKEGLVLDNLPTGLWNELKKYAWWLALLEKGEKTLFPKQNVKHYFRPMVELIRKRAGF